MPKITPCGQRPTVRFRKAAVADSAGSGLRGYPAVALSKGRTAVHGQDLTGDVIGVFASKEDEGRSDVFRLPEPTQGYALSPLFQCGLVDFWINRLV